MTPAFYLIAAVSAAIFIIFKVLPVGLKPHGHHSGWGGTRAVKIGGGLVWFAVLSTALGLEQSSVTALVTLGSGQSWLYALGAAALALPVVFLNSLNPKNWQEFPQVRPGPMSRWPALNIVVVWAVYLLGCELVFRGLLLSALVADFGLWPAAVVVCSLYSLAHLNKSMGEALGSLFSGPLFVTLSIEGGSFLPAFVLHWAIASTSDLTAYYASRKVSAEGLPRPKN